MIRKRIWAAVLISYAAFEELLDRSTGGAFDKIVPCPPKKIRRLERGINRLQKRLESLEA